MKISEQNKLQVNKIIKFEYGTYKMIAKIEYIDFNNSCNFSDLYTINIRSNHEDMWFGKPYYISSINHKSISLLDDDEAMVELL